MKLFILALLVVVATVAAAPEGSTTEKARILENTYHRDENGGFESRVETSNGIIQTAKGTLKEVTDADNKPRTVLITSGTYTLTDEKGVPHLVKYYADEFGYHVDSDLIPKDPTAA